ncbi:MAG: glycoside hydrolase family 43 protein [Verrucomicrobiae bacterium]
MKIQNPIIRGFNPDPSVCRVGADYYLATSTFAYFPGVPIYHSRDLACWRLIGHALDRPSQLDLTKADNAGGIFAPTLRYHDGRFYMVTTRMGGKGNFLVTAKNPSGPWSEPIWIDAENFDPSLLFDDDGTVYYTRRAHQSVVQATINPVTGELTSPLQTISGNFVATDIEGPHLYQINGFYYLVAAEGGTRSGHCVTVGRSSSPWGPFESCPANPVLSHRSLSGNPIRDTGHAEFIQTEDGSWVVFFLAARASNYEGFPHLGRETYVAPLEWRDGWPVINGEKPITFDLDIPTGSLEPHPWPTEPSRDEFDAPVLSSGWIHLRNPPEGSFSLTERPGFLRLHGTKHALSEPAPVAFVGRRQTEFVQRLCAQIEFDPLRESDEAGISVFMNERHFYALAITGERGGTRRIIVRRRVDDFYIVAAESPVPAGLVTLAIDGERGCYHFRYRVSDGEWQSLGSFVSKHLAPEMAGTWTGVVWALYATGNGEPCAAPADYDWCEWPV